MPPLRGALVGFGQVAEKAHRPGFAAAGGFEIVAVAESQAERAAAARAAFPTARLYADLDALLAAEASLDFVDIATPPFLHGAQALAALRAGRHVLCEKPLTLDPRELASLRQAAAGAGRVLFTVHNWASAPPWRRIFSLADSVGPLRRVSIDVRRARPALGANPDDWRRSAAAAGGGVLVDHGWHNLYLIHRLLGGGARVWVERLEAGSGGVDEEAAVRLEFPGGSVARLSLTWRAPERSNGAVIEGERGTILLEDDRVSVAGAPGSFCFPQKLSAGSAHPDWFADMLADFRAALEGRPERARNLEEAAFCCETLAAAYASRALPA